MEEIETASFGFSSELVIGFIFFAAEEFDTADAFLFFTAARSSHRMHMEELELV